MDHARLASKRLPLLPGRQKQTGPRSIQNLTIFQRELGDAYWKCGVEVAKVVYTQIDRRYSLQVRRSDDEAEKAHSEKMDEAKKILNEARNDVLEAVLPLFTIKSRPHDQQVTPSKGDVAAHDFIIRNIFDNMVRTYKAWADQFVEEAEVSALVRTVENVGQVQRERLAGWILNYEFTPMDLSVKKRD